MENETNWADLTPEQKLDKRYEWWLSAGIEFPGPEARKNYQERAQRFVDAYRVEEPDLVATATRNPFRGTWLSSPPESGRTSKRHLSCE